MGERLDPEIGNALNAYVLTGNHEPLFAAIEAYGRRCALEGRIRFPKMKHNVAAKKIASAELWEQDDHE